jgi:hypothetical protein
VYGSRRIAMWSAIALVSIAGGCTSNGSPASANSTKTLQPSAESPSQSPPVNTGFKFRRPLFYYGSNGDIWARLNNGIDHLTTSSLDERNPAVSAGGDVLFQRASTTGSELVLMFGSAMHECCFRSGVAPAFPTTVLKRHPRPRSFAFRIAARVLLPGAPGGRSTVPEIAIGDPGSEAEFAFPVAKVGSRRVMSLSFDAGWPGDPYLYLESGSGIPYVQRLKLEHDRVVRSGGVVKLVHFPRKEAYVAPASSRASSVDMIRICCEGTARSSVDLVRVDVDGAVGRAVGGRPRKIVGLEGLDLDLSRRQRLFVKYAGCLGAGAHHHLGLASFGVGKHRSWFVGDGKKLYLVDSAGRYARIRGAFTGGVAPIPVRCT